LDLVDRESKSARCCRLVAQVVKRHWNEVTDKGCRSCLLHRFVKNECAASSGVWCCGLWAYVTRRADTLLTDDRRRVCEQDSQGWIGRAKETGEASGTRNHKSPGLGVQGAQDAKGDYSYGTRRAPNASAPSRGPTTAAQPAHSSSTTSPPAPPLTPSLPS
jgi:hypothetical protein